MLNFNDLLALAPMAGFSDEPMRKLVSCFGVDFCVSEMISSNALVYENEKTLKMLKSSCKPYIVQLAGADLDIILKAVLQLNKLDFIQGIDFNAGCPVNKVVKQGAGSALLKDLDKLKKILEIIKKHNVHQYTSVKIRLGFNTLNHLAIARACEEAGVDFISVHARTRADFYSGKARIEALKELKESVKIPLIANGDINAQNAQEVQEFTKIKALMIGRAAIGKPWVFAQIRGKKVDESFKNEVIQTHFEELLKHYGKGGVPIFRKHLHEYSKGYENAAKFREEINHTHDENLVRKLVQEFFKN